MKLTFSIICLSLLHSFTVWGGEVKQENFDCSKLDQTLDESYNQVLKKYKKGDVSDLIDSIDAAILHCGATEKKNWRGGLLDFYRKSGYEAELRLLRDTIKSKAQFGEVGPELDLYKSYANKLLYSEKYVEKFVSKYQNMAQESLKKSQKQCSPIDLRNDTLGPVRNQDSVGWCYSFASADLLSYKLGKKVSAVDVAVTVNDTYLNTLRREFGKGEKDIDGASIGALERALKKIKEKGGACLEEQLRSEDNGTSMLFFNLLDLENFKKTGVYKQYKFCPSSVTSLFPEMSFEEFKSIMNNTYYTNFLQTLVNEACDKREKVPDYKVRYSTSFADQVAYTYSLGSKEKIFKQIDDELNKKNILLVGYLSSILTDADYHSEPEGGHASVIVGRRFNPQTGCEYLIRNSWGRSCGQYDKSLTCEEGNIWVPKSLLTRGIRDAISLR